MSANVQSNGHSMLPSAVSIDRLLAPVVGRIVGPVASGEVLVEHPGYAPVPARLLAALNAAELTRPQTTGREVLLVFEGCDPQRPIIVGLLHDPLESLVSMEIEPEGATTTPDPVIDGNRVTIDATDEIVLRCGEGSITLRKDGKIVIKGTHLLSRSSGPNRIKGASVNIN